MMRKIARSAAALGAAAALGLGAAACDRNRGSPMGLGEGRGGSGSTPDGTGEAYQRDITVDTPPAAEPQYPPPSEVPDRNSDAVQQGQGNEYPGYQGPDDAVRR